MIRVNSKDMKEKGARIRLERQEYPNKSLSDAIEEKLYADVPCVVKEEVE